MMTLEHHYVLFNAVRNSENKPLTLKREIILQPMLTFPIRVVIR